MVSASAIWLKPTAKNEGLKGPVREVRTELARTMDQHNYRKIDFNLFQQIQRFSSSGNLLEEININPDGTVAFRELYKYNDDGTLKEKASCDPDKNPRVKWQYHYESIEDGKQKVVEQFVNEDGEGNSREEFVFDNQGRKILDQTYEDGELVIINEFDYETINNETKMTWLAKNTSGMVIKHREYLFDAQENIKQKQEFTSQGNIESKEISTYSENGPIIETAIYQKDQLIFRYIYDYEFDDQNNWTLKTTKILYNSHTDAENEEYVSEIAKREIEYYA